MTHKGQVLAHSPTHHHDAPSEKAKPAHKVAHVKAEPAKVAAGTKKIQPAPKVALSTVKTRKKRQAHHATPKRSGKKAHGAKKAPAPLRHSQAKLQAHQKRRVASLMGKKQKSVQDPTNTTAAATTATAATGPAGPTTPVPADGFEKDLADTAAFQKAFTITFKVKFDNFLRNEQALLKTDGDTLFIQALGPVYQSNEGKISAWMKVDSGIGPNNRGLGGSDGSGQLLSQVLSSDTWHTVKFQKTNTTLNLEVDGTPCHLCPITIDRGLIIHLDEFDQEAGSTKIQAGAKAGTGDIGLTGSMGDVTVVEGGPSTA